MRGFRWVLLGILLSAWSAGGQGAGALADLSSPSARIRARAALGLAAVREPAVVPALLAVLDDPEAGVRRAAVRALGEQRDRRAVPGLLNALADRDGNVRFYAAHALGEIKDPAAAEGLLAALRDPVHGVRSEAAWALRELRDPGIADRLIAEFAREDADVAQAGWLIRQVVGEGAIPALAELLGHERETIRLRAFDLLLELNSRQAVPVLVACLENPSVELRARAVRALLALRDERAVKPLQDLALRETDAELRALAQEGVRRLTAHPSIVGHWSFDGSDGKTVRNEIPVGGGGEIAGGAALVPGKVGQGIQCGPGQYVALGQPPMLPIAQRPLTFTAWVKPTGGTGVVVARGGAFSGFSFYLSEGLPCFGIRREQGQPAYIAKGGTPLPVNEWTHLAGVVREKAVEVWVNGNLAGKVESPGFLLNNAGQGMEIGFDVANSPCELVDPFPGVIDEVRMYHADLGETDIRQQYEREK